MGLLDVFFRPDEEESRQGQNEIAEAANILQTGEFQILQLAYYDWHGRELPESATDRLFAAYMIHSQVPDWARHYAQRILERATMGALDIDNPAYHRYDPNYITHVPDGVRRFWLAIFWCASVIVGGVAISTLMVDEPASLLPPYFERSTVEPDR